MVFASSVSLAKGGWLPWHTVTMPVPPLVVSVPGPLKEESLFTVAKPLPEQLWETKEVGDRSRSACCHGEVLQRGHREGAGKGQGACLGTETGRGHWALTAQLRTSRSCQWVSTAIPWLPSWPGSYLSHAHGEEPGAHSHLGFPVSQPAPSASHQLLSRIAGSPNIPFFSQGHPT